MRLVPRVWGVLAEAHSTLDSSTYSCLACLLLQHIPPDQLTCTRGSDKIHLFLVAQWEHGC
jgi:hypothetical protein